MSTHLNLLSAHILAIFAVRLPFTLSTTSCDTHSGTCLIPKGLVNFSAGQFIKCFVWYSKLGNYSLYTFATAVFFCTDNILQIEKKSEQYVFFATCDNMRQRDNGGLIPSLFSSGITLLCKQMCSRCRCYRCRCALCISF